MSVDEHEDPANSDICSYEDPEVEQARKDFINLFEDQSSFMMMVTQPAWRTPSVLSKEQQDCSHQWQFYLKLDEMHRKCYICRLLTPDSNNAHCDTCSLIVCIPDAQRILNLSIPIKPKMEIPKNKTNLSVLVQEQAKYILDLQQQIQILQDRVFALEAALQEQQSPNFAKNPGKEKMYLENIEPVLEDCDDEICASIQRHPALQNNLLNCSVIVTTEGEKRVLYAIIDTGASRCFIDTEAFPKKCWKQTDKPMIVNVLGGSETTNHTLSNAKIIFNKEEYLMPYTYINPLRIG